MQQSVPARPIVAKPKPKPVVTEIQLSEEVTVRQLAAQLDVTPAELERSLLEWGEKPSSHEDVLSPESAELAAMSFGKTVVFSQAFLVSSRIHLVIDEAL